MPRININSGAVRGARRSRRKPLPFLIHRCYSIMYSCLSLMLVLQLASSMASSFAANPTASAMRQRRSPLPNQHSANFSVRGGSTPPPPPQDEEVVPLIPSAPAVAVGAIAQALPADVENPAEVTTTPPAEEGEPARDTRLGPKAPPPGLIRAKFPTMPWQVVPNWLTYIRCLAIPALIAVFYAPGQRHVATSALFAVASLTDYLDGYLARRWDITSAFGAFIDPVVRTKSKFL